MPRKPNPIPWLGQRGGVYYVFWHAEAKGRTERFSLRTNDTHEAQKRYAAFLVDGPSAFAGVPGRPPGLTVSTALDDYRREHVATKVVDKTRAENAIVHLKAYFGAEQLRDIDIPASRAYAQARRMGAIGGGKRHKNKAGADATIRRELVVLGAAAQHALRWKRILATEMPSIEMPAEPRNEEVKYLAQDEFAKVANAATGRLKDFVLLAYYTAARRASIERLTKFQVNLKTNRINLTGPTEDVNQRRSKKRRPIVPIAPEIRPVVERLISEGDTEWLLGSPLDLYRPFRKLMDGLGFEGRANPHILRHSRATHLLQAGVPIYDVARLLGDTVATVERVYGHHSPEFLAETIRRSGA